MRSVQYLSRSTLDLLYKLTVRSQIDYGLHIFFHSLKQTEIRRISQLQYRADKLASGALHLTSQIRLTRDLGWETIPARAEMLGLTAFYKIHYIMTRPLIWSCMTPAENKLVNLRKTGTRDRDIHTMEQNTQNHSSHILLNSGTIYPRNKEELT